MLAVSPKQTLLMFLRAGFFLLIFKAQILILFETNYNFDEPQLKAHLSYSIY